VWKRRWPTCSPRPMVQIQPAPAAIARKKKK
jgi:hypothetical protein